MAQSNKSSSVDTKDVFFLAGLGSVCYGIWQIAPPWAWIVGGSVLLLSALLFTWGRRGNP